MSKPRDYWDPGEHDRFARKAQLAQVTLWGAPPRQRCDHYSKARRRRQAEEQKLIELERLARLAVETPSGAKVTTGNVGKRVGR